MKKLLFGFMAIALITSASSCKKCGYCVNAAGDHSSATCQSSGIVAAVSNPYKQAEADCNAQIGSHWVVQ